MQQFDEKYYTRAAYTQWQEDQTRFNDLDTLGHVNSNRMQEFFVSLRSRFLMSILPDWPQGPVVTMLKLSTVEHTGELHFPARIETGLAVERLGRTSFTLMLAIFDGDHCIAVAQNVFVFVDSKTRLPTPPPIDTRDALQKAA